MSSKDWTERSLAVFPDGSLGEYGLAPDDALVLSHGNGAHVFDTAGRQLLDFTMGWGSVMLGHAHPAVVEAVTSQVALGSNFSYVTAPAVTLAETIQHALPCAERVRFCASGTEATMYGVRFARAATGRSKILKFEGAYHGANEFGAVSLFPEAPKPFPAPTPTSAGIPAGVLADILVAPFNDLDETARIVRAHAADLAAIIVEPLHRCTVPRPGFLVGLRELADEVGAKLVFDETVTGFRLSYGGAQSYYGVTPDLCALGKGLGGGYPVGAIAGRSEILDLCAESRIGKPGYVWYAASLGGNPITSVASLATLAEMRKPDAYDRFFASGERLREGLRKVTRDLGIAAQILGDGPLCSIAFTDREVVDYRSGMNADGAMKRSFLLGLLRAGVFLNPMSTKLYISLAHTDDIIDEMLEISRSVLEALRA